MTDTPHQQEKEAYEDGVNRVLLCDGVPLGSVAITQKTDEVTGSETSATGEVTATVTGANNVIAYTPSDEVKAAIAMWKAAQPPVDPPPSNPPPSSPPPSDPPPTSTPPPPPPPPPPPEDPPPSTSSKVSMQTHAVPASLRVFLTNVSVRQNSAITGVQVDWGDGNTEAMLTTYQAIEHDYAAPGPHTVTVTATAANGEIGIATFPLLLEQLAEPPDPRVTAEGEANLTATLAGGIAVDITAMKGDVVPLVAGDFTKGALVFYGDGKCGLIANDYMEAIQDLAGHFKLNISGKAVYDSLEVIWAGSHTRPFWVVQPEPLPSPDLSAFPNFRTVPGRTTSMADAYNSADNGRMRVGPWCIGFNNTGERFDLGEVDEATAKWLVDPTPENAATVLGLADAFAPFPFHCRDSATGKMVSLAGNPKIATSNRGQNGNALKPLKTDCPFTMSEAQAHAPTAFALACALYDTDYHKDQLRHWANYVGGLWQTWAYRLPSGYCSVTHGQTRGKARGLNVVRFAALLADTDGYFRAMVDSAVDEMDTLWANQPGIQIDQYQGTYDGSTAFAPWQHDPLIWVLGKLVQDGWTKAQATFDHFAELRYASMLDSQDVFSSLYNNNWKDANKNIVDTWSDGLAAAAVKNTKLAAALQLPEDSMDLQRAMGWSGPAGAYSGYPTSPTGYAAQEQPALAMCVDVGTDQERANAAFDKFCAHALPLIDYSQGVKYDHWPKTRAA